MLMFLLSLSLSASCPPPLQQGYFISVDDECVACPEGTVCGRDGGSTQARLQLLPGYWRVSLNSDEIFECPYPKGCIGDNGTLAADLNYGSDDDDGSGDDNSTARKQRRLSRRQRTNGERLEGQELEEGDEEDMEMHFVALSSSSSSASSSSSRLGERKSRLLGAVPGDAFGDAYCNVGYMGPLCGVCDTSSVPSYYFDVDAEE